MMPRGYYPRPSTEDRFKNLYIPVPESGCWLWIGNTNEKGYGHFKFNEKTVKAHRYAYEHKKGKIPDGLELDHLCRVRCCINPSHLEAVTHKVNVQRGETGKYARSDLCLRGHSLFGDNLYIVPSTGKRQCRACIKINSNKRRK